MSVTFKQGNIFSDLTYAIVNPVSCTGICGSGLDKVIKGKFPENYHMYRRYCDEGNLHPGSVFITGKRPVIINAAVTSRWGDPPRIEWVREVIMNVVRNLPKGYKVAFPALGCGEGGLEWNDVKREFNMLDREDIDAVVYEPQGHIEPVSTPEPTSEPEELTPEPEGTPEPVPAPVPEEPAEEEVDVGEKIKVEHIVVAPVEVSVDMPEEKPKKKKVAKKAKVAKKKATKKKGAKKRAKKKAKGADSAK